MLYRVNGDNNEAIRYVLRILNRRDYTRFEILNKLTRRGYDSKTVSDAIEWLEEKNLINDERYTENYVYSRLNAGYGKIRIGFELKSRGIKEETVERILSGFEELESAEKLFNSRFEQFKNKTNAKHKMFAFLQRRGYAYDTINTILNDKEGII